MLTIQVGLEVTFSFILCVCKQSRFWQECKFAQAGPKPSLLDIKISTNIKCASSYTWPLLFTNIALDQVKKNTCV